MNHLILSRDGTFCKFDKFPANHFITTNRFGNCSSGGGDSACLNRIKSVSGASKLFKIMPEHKDRIDLVLSIGTPDIYWNCDGLIAITNSAFRVALISPTGDCPAVLYYYQGSEMKFGIRAVVHSGWKGTSLNIAAKCVRGIAGIYNQLAELHKARTEFSHSNLICAVWDGICKKCYTVTPEMNAVFPDDYDNGHLGLADIIVKQLETAGVASSNILRSRICPHCETDLFGRRIFASYRGGDENFRNALVISA